MAVEFQIYLHDETSSSNARRSIQVIKEILINTDPSSTEPQWVKITNKGYIASYANDSNINFIFNRVIIDQLHSNHLKPELTSETQLLRQVLIPEVTPEIYAKPPADIIGEVDRISSVKILKLSTYSSPHNSKKYIFATIDSKDSKEQFVNTGSIELFGNNFTVLPTRSKRRTAASSSNHPAQNIATPSVQRSGQGFTPTNNWGVQRQYSYNGTSNINYPPPNWSSPRNTSPQGPQTNRQNRPNQHHYRSFLGLSDQDIKFISTTYSRVCETLSYGLENPKAYVSLINQSLAHQGFPEIHIAESALNDCRKLYFTNLSGKIPTSLSQTSPNQQSTTSSITTSSTITPTTSQTTSQTQPTILSPASPTPLPSAQI